MNDLDDRLIVVAKRECLTCAQVEPLLRDMARNRLSLKVYVQDDAGYAAGVTDVIVDDTLEQSFRLDIEIVPTLGEGLPEMRPGCGSKSLDPGIAEELIVRFGNPGLVSHRVNVGSAEDPIEACFDRGWTDGLPVVPPTPARVLRMLRGTRREPGEVLGLMPPDLVPWSVEKVGVNAVMAGCKPEYSRSCWRGRGRADRGVRHARRAVHHHVRRPGVMLASIPVYPTVIGVILGPLLESELRRALVINGGDWRTFVTRPGAATILAIALTPCSCPTFWLA